MAHAIQNIKDAALRYHMSFLSIQLFFTACLYQACQTEFQTFLSDNNVAQDSNPTFQSWPEGKMSFQMWRRTNVCIFDE